MPVVAIPCGFKSHLPHEKGRSQDRPFLCGRYKDANSRTFAQPRCANVGLALAPTWFKSREERTLGVALAPTWFKSHESESKDICTFSPNNSIPQSKTFNKSLVFTYSFITVPMVLWLQIKKLPFFFFIFICWYPARVQKYYILPFTRPTSSPDVGLSLDTVIN